MFGQIVLNTFFRKKMRLGFETLGRVKSSNSVCKKNFCAMEIYGMKKVCVGG